VTIERATLGEFLEAVAARRPTPGGGAVAAVTLGLAAALGEMVLQYRAGRSSGDPAAESAIARAMEALGRIRGGAARMADEDVEAFGRLSALWKLPPDDPARRDLPRAVAAAIEAPRRVMEASLEALAALHGVRHLAGRGLRSDLAIAAILARAAAESAAWNVRINLPQVADAAQRARLEREAADALRRAEELRAGVEEACGG
jgi:formiminotetrahydrofolate cyclodeaminase